MAKINLSEAELNVAKSSAKAIFLQSAALAGFGVSDQSPERLSRLIDENYSKVDEKNRPEAVASILKIIASTLTEAHNAGLTFLTETSVDAGSRKACPVYPND